MRPLAAASIMSATAGPSARHGALMMWHLHDQVSRLMRTYAHVGTSMRTCAQVEPSIECWRSCAYLRELRRYEAPCDHSYTSCLLNPIVASMKALHRVHACGRCTCVHMAGAHACPWRGRAHAHGWPGTATAVSGWAIIRIQ